MVESLYSESWYRVSGIHPKLRSHVKIHRHRYRGQDWYVLQDQANGKNHRFSEDAYFFICLMDGSRTLDEIWNILLETRQGDALPTQEEIIHLLHQLHLADALQSEIKPSESEVRKRRIKQRRADFMAYVMNPMAIRIPLFNPECMLQKIEPLIRVCTGRTVLIIWLLTVLSASLLALQHWQGLSQNFSDRILSQSNLLFLWLLFPVIKFMHEMGHAILVKKWGGEVHSMGVMFLVFMPVPYVDGSAASSFTHKYQRIMVGAGGMLVELFLASVAMFVWLNVEQGMVHTLAYNVMVIAGISTIFFNANPLLRFDGYYILADALEIPNLAMRANRYLGYLIQKYLFGAKAMQSPVTAEGERGWFVFYAVASFFYRMFIMFFIILFVASKYFIIGILLAIWAVVIMFVMPLSKSIKSAYTNPLLRKKRMKMVFISSAFLTILTVGLLFIPFPSWTNSEGVVWVPENSTVHAQGEGFVERVIAQPNAHVKRGEALFQLRDPNLHAQRKILQAELVALDVKYTANLTRERVVSQQIRKEMDQVQAELINNQAMIDALLVKSPENGVFVMPTRPQDFVGRYVERGMLLGYVTPQVPALIITAVSQAVADRVRNGSERVQVRLVDNVSDVLYGSLLRAVPAATTRVPSLALTVEGGGDIALDSRSRDNVKSLQKYFYFFVRLSDDQAARFIGQRAYLRFEHASEPLGRQWYRMLRQLILKRLQV